MEFRFILTDYIKQAMAQAVFEDIGDGTFGGTIPSCWGVLAFGDTVAECRDELQSVLEGSILTGLWWGHPLPVVAGIDLNPRVAKPVEQASQLAKIIAGEFYGNGFDLSARVNAPTGSWSLLPEFNPLRTMEDSNVPARSGRLFLTFIAAMDRSRDAMALWRAGAKLYEAHPEVFEPAVVSAMPVSDLRQLLSDFRVSQRHGPDTESWYTIATTLSTEKDCPVHRVIADGVGDAPELLTDLRRNAGKKPRFPMLRGPKIGPMWARMMAAPGNAQIDRINTLPVAVDVQVRRVTENLGITATRGMDIEDSRHTIQQAWQDAVAFAAIGGPKGIADTCAALDPALWLFGKHGCAHCEKAGSQIPISQACDSCQYPFPAGPGNGHS